MDLKAIVGELKRERERLSRAIAALEGLESPKAVAAKVIAPAPKANPVSTQKRGVLTPAGRKRLSELMKKRWAERRKSG